MSKIDQLLLRLKEPIVTGKLTKREYARRAGLQHGHLHGIERPDWNPTSEVIRKLERGLAVRPLGNGVRHGANQRSVAA